MPSNVLAATRVIQIPASGRERPATAPDWPTAELRPDLLPEPEGISRAGGTLLAVVPIPGTGSSLAIVGYTISTAPRETGIAPVPPLQADQGLVVDHARRCAWMSGKQVALTYQEFELLAFLSAHPDQVFSRNDLLAHVWGYEAALDAGTSTVTVHVRRLREKIEDDPSAPRLIETVWGVGYRFAP